MLKEMIPWVCSATGLTMIWFMGNKTIVGPIMGLISQGVWFIYLFLFWEEAHGLTPAVIGFTIVHVRNLIKWLKE